MRLAAYLCTSRHGIFYFRFPVPVERHPAQKRGHIKVSLGTRDPREALKIARFLGAAGQSVVSRPKVRSMRYEDMRNHVRDHFSDMLKKFQDRTADEGPADEIRMGRPGHRPPQSRSGPKARRAATPQETPPPRSRPAPRNFARLWEHPGLYYPR
ncbi:DUF6538 domain-containing protein [Rhodosalinus sp.]|uniref:DUF6538 domain-containing protein n=1 Tax=Rhodosalinus sp. TaxID=2047741 RepID=UPI00397D4B5B